MVMTRATPNVEGAHIETSSEQRVLTTLQLYAEAARPVVNLPTNNSKKRSASRSIATLALGLNSLSSGFVAPSAAGAERWIGARLYPSVSPAVNSPAVSTST